MVSTSRAPAGSFSRRIESPVSCMSITVTASAPLGDLLEGSGTKRLREGEGFMMLAQLRDYGEMLKCGIYRPGE